jgi:hypothetical protein
MRFHDPSASAVWRIAELGKNNIYIMRSMNFRPLNVETFFGAGFQVFVIFSTFYGAALNVDVQCVQGPNVKKNCENVVFV